MPKSLLIFITFLIVFTSGPVQSQSYEWAAGLKLSKFMGMSVVYSPKEKYSVEGIISKNLWTNESGLSLIARHHRKIITRGLNFYGGAGIHYGMYEDGELPNFGGLLLQGGAEMSLGKTNLAFNLTPMVGVGGQNMKFRIGSDFTIRYVIKKQEREKGRFWKKLGFGKNKDKSERKKKSVRQRDRAKDQKEKSRDRNDQKGNFWDFEWLKKKE